MTPAGLADTPANETGISRQTVSKCLIRLRLRGFIVLVSDSVDDRPAVYRLPVMQEQPTPNTGRM